MVKTADRPCLCLYTSLVSAVILLGLPELAPAEETTANGPLTVAEKSNFRATSRSDDVLRFLERVTVDADHLRQFEIGRTVEGRPIQCVAVARPGLNKPDQLGDKQRLVVLVLGNIHSGECAGKEAMLMLLRELASTPNHPWFENLVLLFIPNYSADANDMVSSDNRPGQIGPAEGMGRRANAQGLDLNRDYMKLDSPECRSLIRLVNRWDPHVFIDMHTTDGSWHRYALTYDIPHNPASPEAVREYQRLRMMPVITRELEEKGISTFYYGNFDREHTRWSTFGDFPRFGTEYMGLRGRFTVLSEVYAYITYKERIIASREFLRQCLDYLASRTPEVHRLLEKVRREPSSGAPAAGTPDRVAIRSEVTPLPNKVVIRGYEPTVSPRERRVRPTEPHDYTVDFYTRFVPTLTVRRPAAYVIPAREKSVLERLKLHGIAVEELEAEQEREVEVYHITSLERRERPYQNRNLLQLEVKRATETRVIPQGSFLVRTNQQLSNLIVYLLEPEANDGFAVWNVFQPELVADSEYPVWRIPAP